jgi:hypothetical protein
MNKIFKRILGFIFIIGPIIYILYRVAGQYIWFVLGIAAAVIIWGCLTYIGVALISQSYEPDIKEDK